MRKTLTLFVFLMLFSSIASAVVVVDEIEEKLYALESVKLSGDLDKNELTITGSGRVISGDNVKVYLFGPTGEILISGLKINMKETAVSFDEKGYFIVPDKGAFSFRAKMEIRTIGQLNLYVPGPMNELTFDLENGYAVDGDQYGLFDENVVIQRAEKVATLITGAFKFSYADKKEFYYTIGYKAFGSSLSQQTLSLKNGERVTEVTGALKWEQSGSKLILDLKGEKATVGIRGFFSSDKLMIPLEEDKHHVLIESEPEKRITVFTDAKELDVSESPIRPQYTNARVFLATNVDEFVVTVEELELKDSLAVAVDSATNTVAITKEGVILAELEYRYQNSGQEYLTLDFTGTPLYAAAGGKPVKLTTEGEEGKLNLAFPKTDPNRYKSFDMVYYTSRPKIAIFDYIKVPLVKTDLPITTATTRVFLPKSVFVLWTLGAEGGSQLPSLFSMVVFVLILCVLSYFLIKKHSWSFFILNTIFHAGLYYFNAGLFYISVSIILIIIATRYLFRYKNISSKFLKWTLIVIGILVVAVMLITGIALFFSNISSTSTSYQAVEYSRSYDEDYGGAYEMEEAVMDAAPAPMMAGMKAMLKREATPVEITSTKKGVLPVKLELPRLGNLVTVKHHSILRPEDQPQVSMLVAAGWLKYIFYLIALFCGVKAYKFYKKNKPVRKK